MRDTESRYWEHVTASCMTEESDDENGEKIVTHQLLWRSECKCVVGLLPALPTIWFLIVDSQYTSAKIEVDSLGAFITQVISVSE